MEKKELYNYAEACEMALEYAKKDKIGDYIFEIHHKSPGHVTTSMRYPGDESPCCSSIHDNIYYAIWDVLVKLTESLGDDADEQVLTLLEKIRDMRNEIEELN